MASIEEEMYSIKQEEDAKSQRKRELKEPPLKKQNFESEYEKLMFLKKGVTVPGSQGLGAPFGGFMLGGTSQSDAYLYPYIKQIITDNPDAFTSSDDDLLRAAQSGISLFDSQSSRIKRAILTGEVQPQGFDYKIFDKLASEGDVPAYAEQKRIDAMVGDDPALGSRFSSEESPLSPGDRFNYATLDTAEEKRKFFSNLYPEGEFYVKEVGQSFEDPSQRVTIELFSTEPGGPLYQVDRFDYQNTFSGRGLVNLFTETKKAFEGDVEAKARVSKIYNGMGLDIVDVAGELGNFQNLLPALVDALPASKAKAVFLRAASGITKGGAVFGLDKLGQWLDDATSLDEVRGEGVATTDSMESALASAFTAFGRVAGATFGLLSGSPQGKQAFKELFLTGSSNDQLNIVRAAENAGVAVTVGNLIDSGIMKRLLAQSQALSPELYGPVRKEQSEKLLQYLMDKVTQNDGKIDGAVTPEQVGEIIEGMSSKIRNILFDDPLDPTSATLDAQFKADMAGRSLREIQKMDALIRNDLYKNLLQSPQISKAKFDIDTTNLRNQAKAVQEGVLGTQQKTVTRTIEEGPLLDASGNLIRPEGIEEVTENVVESIGGGLSPQLAKISKDLETALFDDPVASRVDSKTVFSVLEQVDTYKKKLAEIVDVTSSENRYVQQLQNALDGIWDQTLNQIDELGVAPEIKEQAAQAKWLSQYMTETMRTGYIGQALQSGNTRPFENLIQPLLDGQKVLGPDDLAALTNLVQGAPANIPKKYLGGRDGEIVAKMTRGQRKKVVDRFRDQLKSAATLALQAEPLKFAGKLREITGIKDLSRVNEVVENPNLKWFFPDLEERKRLVSQANLLEKFDTGLAPYREAVKETKAGLPLFLSRVDLNSSLIGEAAEESIGIVKAIVSKLPGVKGDPPSPGQTSAQDIKIVFNELTGDSRVAVKKQLQKYFLGNILNEISKETAAEGTLGVAYNKVSKAIADMRGKNSPVSALYDWVMEDVPELGDVVSTLSRLSTVFKDAEDFGASLSAAQEAQAAGTAAFEGRVPKLLEILMKQKVMAAVFTEPVTLAQFEHMLKQDQLGKRVQKALGRLIMKTAVREAPRQNYELDSLGDGVKRVSILPMSGKGASTSFQDLAVEREKKSPSGSRLEELVPGTDRMLFESIPYKPRASSTPRPVSSLGSSSNISPAQGGAAPPGGIARLPQQQQLAMLENLGVPLFGSTG